MPRYNLLQDTICARYNMFPIQFVPDTICSRYNLCRYNLCRYKLCRYNLCRYNLYMNQKDWAGLEWKRQKNLAWTWEIFGLEIWRKCCPNCVLTFINRSTCHLFYGYIYVVTWQWERPWDHRCQYPSRRPSGKTSHVPGLNRELTVNNLVKESSIFRGTTYRVLERALIYCCYQLRVKCVEWESK